MDQDGRRLGQDQPVMIPRIWPNGLIAAKAGVSHSPPL